MPGVFKIKNLQDAEFTLTHPDGAGAISIDSNKIANIDTVNAALSFKVNTADLKEIGVGQTWQNVTGSRALGITYTNTSGKPIYVAIANSSIAGSNVQLTVDGILVYALTQDNGGLGRGGTIVPNGSTYSATTAPGSLVAWIELR